MTAARDEQVEIGRAARARAARSTAADWRPSPGRPDPVALLCSQDETRRRDLVPIRHGRMGASAFAFYRGAAAVMAADLATMPNAGLDVQLCGDAHLSNFGMFASPERRQLFDLNDFDETLRGPFEWDVLRLAASAAIAARSNGFGAVAEADGARAAVRAYRESMIEFAERSTLDTWYARFDADRLREMTSGLSKAMRRRAIDKMDKARSRDSLQVTKKMTEKIDGVLRIVAQPPLVMPLSSLAHLDEEQVRSEVAAVYGDYLSTLSDSHRLLLSNFEIVDIAHKVVGVGSVGLRAWMVLMADPITEEPLVLQLKEATDSVLEAHLPKSEKDHPGERVVAGQRAMQAASDPFLGWSQTSAGRRFYWRQMRDMKASADVDVMDPGALALYLRLCGATLARAHARTGSRVAIAAYLGAKSTFDDSVVAFAVRYADLNDADHSAHAAAVAAGEIEAIVGV